MEVFPSAVFPSVSVFSDANSYCRSLLPLCLALFQDIFEDIVNGIIFLISLSAW